MVVKPSQKEEEYFIEQEVKRLKALHEEHLRKSNEEQRQKMKELHYLHCAKCGQKMEPTTLGNVEIDVCPDCAGIYLDAGELQKILDEKTREPFTKALSFARRLWTVS